MTINTISLNSQCIIGVNQVSPMRGKGISIARDLLSHSLFVRLIAIRLLDSRLPGLVPSNGWYRFLSNSIIETVICNVIQTKWYKNLLLRAGLKIVGPYALKIRSDRLGKIIDSPPSFWYNDVLAVVYLSRFENSLNLKGCIKWPKRM